MMNPVMQRPMFRKNGSPRTGEKVSDLQSLLANIRDTEDLRGIVGSVESDNIQRQLGNLLRVPFEEFKGKYVKNPMSGEIEPMSGPLTGTVLREGEMMLDPNSTVREGEFEMVTVIDRREGSDTFGMPISVPKNMDTYSMIRSGEFEFDEIAGMAEGGEMKSDAVGIAEGLDEETMQADPNTTGVAKVSPEQYVELMNQVRGDEVPLEGRVQELAMTVGEQDAQATPLSVLALVQPVFELQEQQGGLAAAPGAQQMMQQAPMQMRDGGIVYRANGTGQGGEGNDFFSTLGGIYDPSQIQAIKQFGQQFFGLGGEEFDTQAARERYEQMLMNKDQMRDQAYLDAAPLLLQLGATALNPEATLSDVFTVGASNLAKFGTNIGNQTKQIQDTALKMALADKQKEENKESAFISAVAPSLIENAFKDPQQTALTALEITEKTISNAKSQAELDVLPEQLDTNLKKSKADLETILIQNKYLPQSTQLSIEKQLKEIDGLIFDNDRKKLDNQYQTVLNQFIEDKENAALQNQLLTNIGARLNNAKTAIENEYLPLEKDLGLEKLNADIENTLAAAAGQRITNDMNEVKLENLDKQLMLEMTKNQMEIEKLKYEIENPKKDWEEIKVQDSFRKEFAGNKIKKDTDLRYDAYRKMKIAVNASNKEGAGGQGDVALIFEFMKMLDPTSTVREGEFATAKETGGVPESIRNTYNQLLSGAFLQPGQRQEFLAIAGDIFTSQLEQFNTEYKTYASIAERNFGADNVRNVMPLPSYNVEDLESVLGQDTISNFLEQYESNLDTSPFLKKG
jgi:hypothetical protein